MLNVTRQNERPYFYHKYYAIEEMANENWENPGVLQTLLFELSFRNTKYSIKLKDQIKNQLEELALECFPFPSTELTGDNDEIVIIDRKKKGLLLAVGYKTGVYGLHKVPRRKILDSLYTKEIPKNTGIKDIKKWGGPGSSARLKEIVYSLARFTKQEKGNPRGDYRISIAEREADLKYLKKKYYDNSRYDWIYPKT
jgi:hypothetical protein